MTAIIVTFQSGLNVSTTNETMHNPWTMPILPCVRKAAMRRTANVVFNGYSISVLRRRGGATETIMINGLFARHSRVFSHY